MFNFKWSIRQVMNSITAECCVFRQDSSHFCIWSTNWKWVLDKEACYIDRKGGSQKEQCLVNKLAAARHQPTLIMKLFVIEAVCGLTLLRSNFVEHPVSALTIGFCIKTQYYSMTEFNFRYFSFLNKLWISLVNLDYSFVQLTFRLDLSYIQRMFSDLI